MQAGFKLAVFVPGMPPWGVASWLWQRQAGSARLQGCIYYNCVVPLRVLFGGSIRSCSHAWTGSSMLLTSICHRETHTIILLGRDTKSIIRAAVILCIITWGWRYRSVVRMLGRKDCERLCWPIAGKACCQAVI